MVVPTGKEMSVYHHFKFKLFHGIKQRLQFWVVINGEWWFFVWNSLTKWEMQSNHGEQLGRKFPRQIIQNRFGKINLIITQSCEDKLYAVFFRRLNEVIPYVCVCMCALFLRSHRVAEFCSSEIQLKLTTDRLSHLISPRYSRQEHTKTGRNYSPKGRIWT